jgi:hypothetical protein
MIVWYGLTMFVSAGLLFLVQPMIARMVLPLLGGAPAVWTACMLFFQMLLLAGYAYADLAPRFLGVRRHALVHLVLILVPLLFLPIQLSGRTPPAGAENPVLWLLLTLGLASGLPFLVLATQAPLLQRWFAATTHRAAGDPYFLYAASNVGSLLALLSYPVLIEPWLPLAEQSRLWALGYGGLAFLVAGCVLLVWRRSSQSNGQTILETVEPLSWWRRLRWLALAFVPSSLMLGVTTYVTTDIAPIPLLWILPLSLYLFSFVLAFSRLPASFYRLCAVLLAALLALLIAARIDWGTFDFFFSFDFRLTTPQLIVLHLATFFIASLVCHGELAIRRPAARRLTEYYLVIALGGMLGGVFNSIVAPLVFDRVIEYPLLFVAVCFLRPRFTVEAAAVPARTPVAVGPTVLTAICMVYGMLAAICFITLPGEDTSVQTRRLRNFFGALVASHDAMSGRSALSHGTTLHGMQDFSKPNEPLIYFTKTSGIGRLFASLEDHPPRTVGAVGLGTGTIACYAKAGQRWIFYEINPAVPKLALDTHYFTYLKDAEKRGVKVERILGDGRLSLSATPTIHDLLIVDAFSSDAIPIHLLTRNALEVYLSKLAPHGQIAFHITNRYVDLTPVLADLAQSLNLANAFFSNDGDDFKSWWLLLARSNTDLGVLAKEPHWRHFSGRTDTRPWTDDFSNVYSVFWPRGTSSVPQAALEQLTTSDR